MRHDPGLDASPPVRYILKVERSGYSPFHLPYTVDGQPPRDAAYRGTQTPPNILAPPSKLITLLKPSTCFRAPARLTEHPMCDSRCPQCRFGQQRNRPRLRSIRLTYAVLRACANGRLACVTIASK